MARFFKPKRRKTNTGPNKNQQKVLRREKAGGPVAPGTSLQERYPHVSQVSLSLRFITPQNQLFEETHLEIQGDDACRFLVACPGRCGGGHFDLSEKIKLVFDARRESDQENVVCREPIYTGSGQACDFRLECRMDVDYTEE